MKTRFSTQFVFFVGLVSLIFVASGMRSMAAHVQQLPLPPLTPISNRVQVTATLQAQSTPTSVMSIRDVGQFTSGALPCDSDCRAELGLADESKWMMSPAGTEMDVAIPCAYPLPDGMCIYYGDLHSHTGYSDGQGTPQQAYQMARANGLSFFAITDHAEQLNESEWNDTLAQAQAATVEDHFIPLRGFEWTSQYGHLNVFGTDSLVRSTDSHYNSLPEFYAWLSAPAQINNVAQFNHPFYPDEPFKNWRYDSLADLHISLIETHNGTVSCVDRYDDALAAGWRVGAASNSDTHQANWGERRGRTGIVAPRLTYHEVINALRARRTFSSSADENLALAMQADGYWMGSVVRNGPIYFDIYAFDPDPGDPIATLELYRNGELFNSTLANTNAFTWSFSLSSLPPPGSWWYVKATQSDGDEAYTSSIWTHQPTPYDVLIRDNVWDIGDVPSANPGWQSPDVWVRNQPDGQLWHENPIAGEINHVYVRAQNVGANPLGDVDVYLYWADPSLGLTWPDSWHSINPIPTHLQNLAPGESIIVNVPWDVSSSVSEHAALLAHLVSAQDPIHYAGYPRWDNNVGGKNVHIVDVSGTPPPPGTLIIADIIFHLANPFAENKTADIHFSSSDFPAQGSLVLHLTTELFDRWMATGMGGVVRGGSADPISRTIAITSPVDAVVYGLPLLAGESSPAMLALGAPVSATLAVRVSEHIDGEEIGGSLYTTSPSGTPRKVQLEAATDSIATDRSVEIIAAVVGDGFVPVLDGTEVRFNTTLGNLSTDTVQTQSGLAGVMLSAGGFTGTAIVQASVSGLATATIPVNIYHACQVRLNDEPTEYNTVQMAVDDSSHITDVVKVAGRCATLNTHGGLSQVVYLSKTVTVRGGYTLTNWTTPDLVANPTTLNGRGQGRVLYVTGDPSTSSGQMISPTIEGLRITGGDAGGLGGGPAGGDAGGGMYVISATANIKSNWVFSNTAGYGGGLYLASEDSTMVNNLVTDNQANSQGSGLYVRGGSPQLIHTTLARNGSAGITAGTGGDGSGIYVTGYGPDHGTVALTNTILLSHTVGITVTSGNTATLEATLWGSGSWANGSDWGGTGTVITGTRNTWGTPAFANPDGGDYHIGVDSAALDAGVGAGVNDDMDGDPRPMGRSYDVGADELRIGLLLTQRAAFDALQSRVRLTYTTRITNTGDIALHAIVTDTLPAHIGPGETSSGTLILPSGTLTWTPVITAPGGIWTQQVAVTVERGYSGPLTNVLQVTTGEGATGMHTHTLVLTPALEITAQATPDPVRAGEPLAYAIYVTNTGNIDLHATISNTLPAHIIPNGTLISGGKVLTWTEVITAPGDVWTQQVVVTVEMDYAGPLTNVLQVTTSEGAMGVYTETSSAIVVYPLLLPIVTRNYRPPEPCAPRLIAEVETGPEPRLVALDTAGRRTFVAHANGITVIETDSFAVITETRAISMAHGIAYDPDRDRIWVTRRNPDRVVVLDGATYAPLADQPAGDGPHSVAYNPANGRVYVTNYWSWTVSMYDAETLAHIGELAGFAEPAHLAVNPVTNKIYVANHRPNQGV
ncbi:MAG: CehA/McbA family metallohydrolase, partial [Chloroflexota bacterium]|nr:CehA/McbA family metallohydrolase [Chloroflexota bacterium]